MRGEQMKRTANRRQSYWPTVGFAMVLVAVASASAALVVHWDGNTGQEKANPTIYYASSNKAI